MRGGQFYRWAVRGWEHVGGGDENEARRLLDLRYLLSSQVAAEYAAAGFTTVVQDNIYGPDVERWLDRLSRCWSRRERAVPNAVSGQGSLSSRTSVDRRQVCLASRPPE